MLDVRSVTSRIEIYASLILCLQVWLSSTHRDDVTGPFLRHHQHHSLTDGVDTVTWSILTPSSLLGPLGSMSGSEEPLLTCNVSRATHQPTNETSSVVISDKNTVAIHKRLCYSHQRKKRAIIAPGTKWCGAGNVAQHRNDLGSFDDVDRCCRDHDHCPLAVEGKSRKFGIYNNSPFTMSSCVCDDAFMQCLNSVGNFASNLIGTIYYNVLRTRCLSFNHGRGDMRLSNSAAASIRENPPFKMASPDIIGTIEKLLQG